MQTARLYAWQNISYIQDEILTLSKILMCELTPFHNELHHKTMFKIIIHLHSKISLNYQKYISFKIHFKMDELMSQETIS